MTIYFDLYMAVELLRMGLRMFVLLTKRLINVVVWKDIRWHNQTSAIHIYLSLSLNKIFLLIKIFRIIFICFS